MAYTKEQQKAYYDKNKDRILSRIKEWRQTKEGQESEKKAYQKYVSDPEKRAKKRIASHNWWHTPKGRYQKYRLNAKNRNIEFKLTLEEFSRLWQKDCVYCGAKIETIGVDRLNPGDIYAPENIVPCCVFCNLSKRDMPAAKYIEHLERITKFRNNNKV